MADFIRGIARGKQRGHLPPLFFLEVKDLSHVYYILPQNVTFVSVLEFENIAFFKQITLSVCLLGRQWSSKVTVQKYWAWSSGCIL